MDVAPDQRTAVVRLSVVPTGNGGDMELNGIRGTTLLTEDPEQPWPRNLSIAGTGSASVVEVSVLPARCDPHAIAEDKAGTRLPVDITAGEWSGQLLLKPDEEFTRSVYAFVTAACAKAGSTESADRRK
ncbi:hypothetical protein J2M53_16685 [Arthrobacter sp. zg-ZUI100]|nr:hypothetical protein [Arthrobacter jiangjiafuii]MBP3037877.1 hypothetical protein [Arthrobacter jiangjiafuii]